MSTENHLSITRIIKHPRTLVFKAWTTPAELKKWFAPKGCTIIFSKLELYQGGAFHWCVKSPNYPDCWCTGVFIEIVSPSLIQYRIRLADEKGVPVSAEEMFKDKDWPEETLVTVRFREVGDFTEINIHQTVAEGLARKTGAYNGWLDMLDLLEESISSK
ncbi:MAG: SRPBCC domain-containing protein [Chryseolinea sp.]